MGQYLSNIPGKHEIKEPQKKGRIVHCTHILWEVLMWKHKTYFTGEITSNVAEILSTE